MPHVPHVPHVLHCADKPLDLSRPRVMGILNVTPDSFSDGGRFASPAAALAQARRMVAEGAALIDVGGESTRPGAAAVSEQEELDRVIPVIEALRAELPAVISVDTSKAAVMRAAVAAGAGLINDVRALREEGALAAAAALAVPVCLMHMQGEPRTMQDAPHYDDVAAEVGAFLRERMRLCEQAGINRARLLLDPGFGFGKRLADNLSLLKRLGDLAMLGAPLVVGVSRKAMIGAVLEVPVEQRLYGSIALAALAVMQGAAVIRAHDVAATVQAVNIAAAVRAAQ
ncbi:MAG: dihydropteroate synthase [Pseudomonadota bacterium]